MNLGDDIFKIVKCSKSQLKKIIKFHLFVYWTILRRQYKPKAPRSFKDWTWSIDYIKVNWGDLLLREIAEIYFDLDKISKKYSGAIFGGTTLTKDFFSDFYAVKSNLPILATSCGARNSLNKSTPPRSLEIMGVRGTLTQKIYPSQIAVGDPGMLAPILFNIDPTISNKAIKIFIPHLSDSTEPSDTHYKKIYPMIWSGQTSLSILKKINSANFILAGSLHAGICAYATGTPFAFYDGSSTEDKFKYQDFASINNLNYEFHDNFTTAIAWYMDPANTPIDTFENQFETYAYETQEFSKINRKYLLEIIRRHNTKRNMIHALKVKALISLN
jgi:hypothetical protein